MSHGDMDQDNGEDEEVSNQMAIMGKSVVMHWYLW